MLGSPKYTYDDEVKFIINGKEVRGKVAIIDAYGTFEQNEEVSYDIFVESENTLYKHIRESGLYSHKQQ